MKLLGFSPRGEIGYSDAAAFAAHIYETKLEFHLTQTPDYFITLSDETRATVGCIGMNSGVRHSLFMRDPPILKLLEERKKAGKRIIEQSVLALHRASSALPILLGTIILAAHHIGADELCFAGIDVSIRTLRESGFVFDELGAANHEALTEEEWSNYARWFSLYTPIICVVATAQAQSIVPMLREQVREHITIAPSFAEFLHLPPSNMVTTSTNS